MAALAFSITPRGVCIAATGSEPLLYEPGNDVQLINGVNQLLTDDITSLLVCRGPGSFTSIRVVLSLAAGLCIARPNMECYTATSFELLAFEAGYPPEALMLVYSHQGYFYAQTWKGEAASDEARRLRLEDVPQNIPIIQTPSGHELGQTIHKPQALTLLNMYKANKLNSTSREPFYVHNPEFKKQKSSQSV